MKLLFIIGLLAFLIFSCKQDRVCTCSDGVKIKMTWQKKESKTACEKYSDSLVTCELK